MKLTAKQKKLVEQIIRLHNKNEPLNITAVKRRHPSLIKRVYAVTPYWGWKQALQDAGLSYKDIRVELQEHVECHFCGKQLKHLCSHLPRVHHVTCNEYTDEFSDSDILSEYTRSMFSTKLQGRIMQQGALTVKHWEPIWSEEYVLDVLAELLNIGMKINQAALQSLDSTLANQCYSIFGSVDEAFKRIGVDPDDVRLHYEWEPISIDKLQSIFHDRLRKGLSISRSDMERECKDWHIIEHAVRRHYNNWANAVHSLGADYFNGCSGIHKYKSQKDIVQSIRDRRAKGLGINWSSLCKGNHQDGRLYYSGIRLFGSWQEAVEAAGYKFATIHAKGKYPNKTSVLNELKRRHREGLPIIGRNLSQGPCGDKSLYRAIRKFYGTCKYAVEAAGLSYAKARRRS